MVKIKNQHKISWVECYSLKRFVNCVSNPRKNTTPLWLDIFALPSDKHRVVGSSFEFQQKADTYGTTK